MEVWTCGEVTTPKSGTTAPSGAPTFTTTSFKEETTTKGIVVTTSVSKCQVSNLLSTPDVSTKSEPESMVEQSKSTYEIKPNDEIRNPSITITANIPKTLMEVEFKTLDVSEVKVVLKKLDGTTIEELTPEVKPDVRFSNLTMNDSNFNT